MPLFLTSHAKDTLLHRAILQGGQSDVIKYLVEAGADLNITANDGTTVLHAAASGERFDICSVRLAGLLRN